MADPIVRIIDLVIAEVDEMHQTKMSVLADVETLLDACEQYVIRQEQRPVHRLPAVIDRLEILGEAIREEQRRSARAAALISRLREQLEQCRTEEAATVTT